MNLTQLANLGEFIGGVGSALGAIAVLATLVYLAAQVKHNTAALEASAVQAWFGANSELNVASMQSGDLSAAIAAAGEDSRALTEKNWVQFHFWCQMWVQMAHVVHDLHRRGVIDQEVYEMEIHRVAGVVRHWPGVRQWWEAGGRTQVPQEIALILEASGTGSFSNVDWDADRGFHAQTPRT